MKHLLNAVIALHYFVFLGMVVAIPMVIIHQPWYMAVVIITVIVRIMTSERICPLSALEVLLQGHLGLPKKYLFLKHHVMEEVPGAKKLFSYVLKLNKELVK